MFEQIAQTGCFNHRILELHIFSISFSMNIIFKAIDATFTQRTGFLDRMDPYLVIYYGGERKKTSVQMGRGKNPRWNEQFVFTRTADPMVRIQAWDRDILSPDDIIGEGQANISSVFTATPGVPVPMPIDIMFNGHHVGKVNLQVINGGGEGVAKDQEISAVSRSQKENILHPSCFKSSEISLCAPANCAGNYTKNCFGSPTCMKNPHYNVPAMQRHQSTMQKAYKQNNPQSSIAQQPTAYSSVVQPPNMTQSLQNQPPQPSGQFIGNFASFGNFNNTYGQSSQGSGQGGAVYNMSQTQPKGFQSTISSSNGFRR